MKILARGAEAVIEKLKSSVIKNRVRKSYRYPELDEKLRRIRTRTEARLIQKSNSLINTPKLKSLDENNKKLELEYIPGKKLADCLEKLNSQTIKSIGQEIAKLHDNGIIHGDLTTSNMIYSKNKIYIIDFGLGFSSVRTEDKAVDLHVLKEALEARHPKVWEKAWKNIIQGYKSKQSKDVLKRLERVESRGRYKEQY